MDVGAVFYPKLAPNRGREKEQTTNELCLVQHFIVSVKRVTSTMYVVLVLAFGLSREDHLIVINGLIKLKIFSVSIKYRVIIPQIIF